MAKLSPEQIVSLFVDRLIAAQQLELVEGADREALHEALMDAFRPTRRSPVARLVEVLTEHPAVDELFAGDDVVEATMRDLLAENGPPDPVA